jgi:uncharacterized protein YjbI with pentapeptide repeats
MANHEHLEVLRQGVEAWNKWRSENRKLRPNLIRADLRGMNLSGLDLKNLDLRGTVFRDANLVGADLRNSYLNTADLSGADLTNAILLNTNFFGSKLRHADFAGTVMGFTSFGNVDLSEVKNLESVKHRGPSSIGLDTIYKSRGNISEEFLRDCGLPESFITYMRSLTGEAVEFYSCFISYSHKDEEFVHRLYSRMRRASLRVWFAPEDIKGGRKIHEQVFSAIREYDKLLIVLSEHSLQSEWVMTEIRKARKTEREENRRKLFPIRLVDFDAIEKWECFDADTGKDLAVELREYFIPDFSDWKEHDAFEREFDRLLRALKAEEEKA